MLLEGFDAIINRELIANLSSQRFVWEKFVIKLQVKMSAFYFLFFILEL